MLGHNETLTKREQSAPALMGGRTIRERATCPKWTSAQARVTAAVAPAKHTKQSQTIKRKYPPNIQLRRVAQVRTTPSPTAQRWRLLALGLQRRSQRCGNNVLTARHIAHRSDRRRGRRQRRGQRGRRCLCRQAQHDAKDALIPAKRLQRELCAGVHCTRQPQLQPQQHQLEH